MWWKFTIHQLCCHCNIISLFFALFIVVLNIFHEMRRGIFPQNVLFQSRSWLKYCIVCWLEILYKSRKWGKWLNQKERDTILASIELSNADRSDVRNSNAAFVDVWQLESSIEKRKQIKVENFQKKKN